MLVVKYPGTPLAKKLGIKAGFQIRLVNQPEHYSSLFDFMPPEVTIVTNSKSPKDLIHYFAKKADSLMRDIPLMREEVKSNGIIWVSWPKKTSKISTDVTEDTIRRIAKFNKLIDIKVCAVDETWSALKLVIPVKYRL